MTKPELLAMMRLLAGLESWAFSSKTPMPDHLFDALTSSIEVLEREILKDKP